MLSSIRRRKRTVSIGPQSEADAREHIANREVVRRRRNAASRSRSRSPKHDGHLLSLPNNNNSNSIAEGSVLMTPDEPAATSSSSYLSVAVRPGAPSRIPSSSAQQRNVNVNLHAAILTPPPSETEGFVSGDDQQQQQQQQQQREEKAQQADDRKLLAAVEKPRIRYDVEVVTKLVVYAGEPRSLSISVHLFLCFLANTTILFRHD
jgi:hypothetical protein